MEKVIILGAGPLQVPAIKIAKKLGFYVLCIDYNPHAVGFQYADESSIISTVDMPAILAFAQRVNPDYVITSTSDAPVRTAAYVSEKLGLPTGISYENSLCATYKDAMRSRLDRHKIPMPEYASCDNLSDFIRAIEYFDYKCIVKPIDGAASRGVILINQRMDRSELGNLFSETIVSSHKSSLMVEEFVSGPEVSVEAITIGGVTQILAITDKMVTDPPYFVELGHSEQSKLDEIVKTQICILTKQVVAAIGISDGSSHTEIKVTRDGLRVIETAARLGGDFITSKLVPLSTGVDMVEGSIYLAVGREYDFTPAFDRGSAIRFITSDTGYISSITVDDTLGSIPGFREICLYKSVGDAISSPHSSNDRVGHIICDGCCAKDAAMAAKRALSGVSIGLI